MFKKITLSLILCGGITSAMAIEPLKSYICTRGTFKVELDIYKEKGLQTSENLPYFGVMSAESEGEQIASGPIYGEIRINEVRFSSEVYSSEGILETFLSINYNRSGELLDSFKASLEISDFEDTIELDCKS